MNRVHVAVGVIVDAQRRIVIARRAQDSHQGGLWEFPGGKVEAGESVEVALQRELHEELGIDVVRVEPLLKVNHEYPDKAVLLDVWLVSEFRGQARGREGQPLAAVEASELSSYQFPEANTAIVHAVEAYFRA